MVIESKRSVGSALRGGDITGLALKLLRKSTLRHQYHTGRARGAHENKRLRWVVRRRCIGKRLGATVI